MVVRDRRVEVTELLEEVPPDSVESVVAGLPLVQRSGWQTGGCQGHLPG